MARHTIEQSGRTVDDAVQAALRRLGLSRAQVQVEVVEEGRAGIGPIGHRPALVRVTPLGSVDAAEPEVGAGAASPLPRIDDYADPTELDPGERPGSRQSSQPQRSPARVREREPDRGTARSPAALASASGGAARRRAAGTPGRTAGASALRAAAPSQPPAQPTALSATRAAAPVRAAGRPRL